MISVVVILGGAFLALAYSLTRAAVDSASDEDETDLLLFYQDDDNVD
jgi:hypothetical protein